VVTGGIAFLLGMFCGHRRLFPLGVLLGLRNQLRRLAGEGAREPATATAPFVLEIADVAAVAGKRDELCRLIWGEPALPRARRPDAIVERAADPTSSLFHAVARTDRWLFRMAHGINSSALVLTPHAVSKHTTVIFQQGHEGSLRHGAAVLRSLLQRGFRVVALEMPLLGDNTRPTVHLKRHGPVQLVEHDWFQLLDHEFGGNSLRYFVEPVIGCVNQLADGGCVRVAMLGWSGGGWTTTLSAALDPRIGRSFAVAGSLPFSLRRRGELADYENHYPALYGVANYPELYVLSAYGTGRLAMQILNEFDTVAWGGRRGLAYAGLVQRTLDALGAGEFVCEIDDTWAGHGISRTALTNILGRLD
jgi:dienelactone hydrolase